MESDRQKKANVILDGISEERGLPPDILAIQPPSKIKQWVAEKTGDTVDDVALRRLVAKWAAQR